MADRRNARRELLAAALAAAALSRGARAAPSAVIRFAGGRDARDHRPESVADLLRRLLQAAGRSERVEVVLGMSIPRQVVELERGALDVVHLGTGHPALPRFPVLRKPLRRGLPGLRLLISRRELAPTLSRVRHLSELQPWRLGYGASWGDLAEMRRLGLKVVTGDSYPGLFRMLQEGRFDWMHRGLHEIWPEVADPALMGEGLVVVPRLALQIPLDHCFALSPQRGEAWRAVLEAGWAALQANGGYLAWFHQWHGDDLRRAELGQRHVLRLDGYPTPQILPAREFNLLSKA